ncbi:hypothetical protein MKEN_00639400 [Mycena kentingensis (nom. inval.)]|nr:hypothetical protein MKEN_00639400 [Mycena kentingensis (nom. inval.)]
MTAPAPDERPALLRRMLGIAHAPLPDAYLAGIAGSAPQAVKAHAVGWLNVFHAPSPRCFAGESARRVVVTRVDVEASGEGQGSVLTLESEIEATEELLDRRNSVDKSFIIALMDECTTSSVVTLDFALGGAGIPTVSLGLNTAWHNSVPHGSKLRFICVTMASAHRLQACRCEVWDATLRRLVATGVFTGMSASAGVPEKGGYSSRL